jgi:hypothetical protein
MGRASAWHVEEVPMNWVRMEDIKADVEPFPFVPAMCIGLRMLNSDGYMQFGQSNDTMMMCNRERNYLPHIQSSGTIQSFPG